MNNIRRRIKDSNVYAFIIGFIERFRFGDGFGRTHATLQDWNEAYDKGANLSDKIRPIKD